MPSSYLRRPARYASPAASTAIAVRAEEDAGPAGITATYGITALRRTAEGEIAELMFGLLEPAGGGWALAPAPVRLIEVVDRLLDGDQAKLVGEAADGSLRMGPQVCVKMLDSGAETLEALGGHEGGQALEALPRF